MKLKGSAPLSNLAKATGRDRVNYGVPGSPCFLLHGKVSECARRRKKPHAALHASLAAGFALPCSFSHTRMYTHTETRSRAAPARRREQGEAHLAADSPADLQAPFENHKTVTK